MEQRDRNVPQLSCQMAETATPQSERLAQIRAGLSGQVWRDRVDTASVAYGPLYTLGEVQQKIGDSLPTKLGYRRTAVLEPIESYRERIPDEALLKYDDARRSGLFSRFWVGTPAYRADRQTDPWILGEILDTDRYAVIAHWV